MTSCTENAPSSLDQDQKIQPHSRPFRKRHPFFWQSVSTHTHTHTYAHTHAHTPVHPHWWELGVGGWPWRPFSCSDLTPKGVSHSEKWQPLAGSAAQPGPFELLWCGPDAMPSLGMEPLGLDTISLNSNHQTWPWWPLKVMRASFNGTS